MVDLAGEIGIVQLLAARSDARLLLAASDGRGFIAKVADVIAETRKGRQVVNLRPAAKLAVVRIIPADDDMVASIGENRRLLVFPLSELPEMGRGQGVTLQKFRDGSLSDIRTIKAAEGISWTMGGDSGRVRTETDLLPWRAARGAVGRNAPTGFPRNNRFSG